MEPRAYWIFPDQLLSQLHTKKLIGRFRERDQLHQNAVPWHPREIGFFLGTPNVFIGWAPSPSGLSS